MMINDPRDIWDIEVYDCSDSEEYPLYDDFEVTVDDVYEENDNIVIAISGRCYQRIDEYAGRSVNFKGTLEKDISELDISEFYVTDKTIHFEGNVTITSQGLRIDESIIHEDFEITMRIIRNEIRSEGADEDIVIDDNLIPEFLNDDAVASLLIEEIKKIDSKISINDADELHSFLNEYVLDTSYGEQYDEQKWAPVYKTYVNLFNSKIKDGTIGSFVSDTLSEYKFYNDDVEIGARVLLVI